MQLALIVINTFISNAKFRPLLAQSKAGILVVSETDVEFCSPESNLLIVKDPYVAYAVLAQYMDCLLYTSPFIAAVLRLRLDNYTADPHHGLFLLLYVFVLVWAADSGAYFPGETFGASLCLPKARPAK